MLCLTDTYNAHSVSAWYSLVELLWGGKVGPERGVIIVLPFSLGAIKFVAVL